jgi:hypothetical protein
MKIQIRTKDDLEKLLSEGISYAWRINKSRLTSITEVEIYNFSGNSKIVGTFDPDRTKVLENGRVALAFSNAKIENCEFKWVGQYPIKYKTLNNEELKLTKDEEADIDSESNLDPIDKIAEGLKNNFLFQASLGSKELFHSNMLAWILEQQNENKQFEALRLFIKEVAKLDVGVITDTNTPRIAREENKIDLTIKWKQDKDWNLIFIENKMKSIPTSKQLNEYDDKIDVLKDTKTKEGLDRRVKKKLILTPFPSKVQSNSEEMPWENITYSKEIIEDFLTKIKDFEFANAEQTNIKVVLEKYLSFLKIQNDILKYLKLDDSEDFKKRHYDFYSKIAVENEDESEELGEENEETAKHYMSIIRSLRLHDLVLKMAHSNLSNLLEKRFKPQLMEDYYFDSSFTNSTGITSVNTEIIKGKKFFIGIQLQGNQFRHFVRSETKDKNYNIALGTKLFEQRIWFHDLDTSETLLGNGRSKFFKENLNIIDSKGSKRIFCEYGSGGFLYFYQDVCQNNQIPTIESIINMFVSTFKHYELNKTHIEQILDDILKY